MTLGEGISKARKNKSISQEELGRRVNISKAHISYIENDNLKDPLSPGKLIEISKALDDPSILIHHCDTCPIRNEVFLSRYPELNNIERTPVVIVMKVLEEIDSARGDLEPFARKMLRKDFQECPDYQEIQQTALHRLARLELAMEILLEEMIAQGILSVERIMETRQGLMEHCIRQGHHKPELRTGTEG